MAIDLGLVDEDPWTAENVDDLEEAINVGSTLPGFIQAYIGSSAPTGWALLNGQTLTGAQTAYPTLWAVAPTSWRSGANLVLPNTSGGTMIGTDAGSLGTLQGANSRTIAETNLPAHVHTNNHNHGTITSGTVSSDHTHAFSGRTGDAVDQVYGGDGNHVHGPGGGSTNFVNQNLSGGGSNIATTAGSGVPSNNNVTGSAGALHQHLYSGNTGGISANHSHSVAVPNYTGNTGSVGSGTALDTTPRGLVINWILKLI